MADATNSNEIWKDIPGYEGLYQASSMGRIKRLAGLRQIPSKHGKLFMRPFSERLFTPQRAWNGYYYVVLKKKHHSIASLVCASFHGARPEGLHVAHLNGDRADNRRENLKWVTPTENHSHKRDHGTMIVGEKSHLAKLTAADVRRIIELREQGLSYGKIAKQFVVDRANIRAIISGKSWCHVTGFKKEV